MKIISEHTIYCSKEQTRKALELGASIEIEDTRDRYSFLPQYSDSMGCRIKKFEDAYKNCYCDETAAYLIPTAEQMIGWLETIFKEINVQRFANFWEYNIYLTDDDLISHNEHYESRPEATLAAISVALEYLHHNNKK